MDTKQVRLENLKRLVKEHGTQKALSEASGVDVGYISNMVNGVRSIGEKTARNIEAGLGLPKFWMDSPHNPGSTILEQVRRDLEFVDPDKLSIVHAAIRAAIKTDE